MEPPSKEPTRPGRLLVAEDSPDNRLLIQVYLMGHPYQITFEETGLAAVDRIAREDFDLILMDVRMPVMDGLAATRAIRAYEEKNGGTFTPIVALTANASATDVGGSAAAGCDAHLSKPISKAELIAAVEKYRRPRKPMKVEDPEAVKAVDVETPSQP